MDAVQQARAEEAPLRVVGVDLQAARAELEDLLQFDQDPPQIADVGERAEEQRPLLLRLAGDVDAREILADRDLQVRERLVVHQVRVVERTDVLDQPGLFEHRVDFALGFEVIDVIDLVDHLDDVRAAGGFQVAAGLEVAGDAGAQALGLADVEHDVVGVLHEVQTRTRRELLDLLPDLLDFAVAVVVHCLTHESMAEPPLTADRVGHPEPAVANEYDIDKNLWLHSNCGPNLPSQTRNRFYARKRQNGLMAAAETPSTVSTPSMPSIARPPCPSAACDL